MFILTILLLQYIVAIRLSFLYIRRSYYHPQGKWSKSTPESDDWVYVFIPFFNIPFAIDYLLGNWKKKEYKTTSFFKPKKPY